MLRHNDDISQYKPTSLFQKAVPVILWTNFELGPSVTFGAKKNLPPPTLPLLPCDDADLCHI